MHDLQYIAEVLGVQAVCKHHVPAGQPHFGFSAATRHMDMTGLMSFVAVKEKTKPMLGE